MTIDKALGRGLQIFILPAPLDEHAGWQLDLFLDRRARCLDVGAKIAAPDIGLDDDPPLSILSADLIDAFGELKLRKLTQRHRSAGAVPVRFKHHRQRADRIEIVAGDIVEADDDVEPSVALEDEARFFSAQSGGNGVGNILDRQAVAGDGVTFKLQFERREAARLLDPQVGRALDPVDRGRDLGGQGFELIEIVAEQFDRDITANASDKLVEAHLDRLADFEAVADQRAHLALRPAR